MFTMKTVYSKLNFTLAFFIIVRLTVIHSNCTETICVNYTDIVEAQDAKILSTWAQRENESFASNNNISRTEQNRLKEKLKEIRNLSPFGKVDGGSLCINTSVEICYTKECLDAASALLESVNFKLDPCNDFYEFSCRRWIDQNPVPPTKYKWGSVEMMGEIVNNGVQKILKSQIMTPYSWPVQQAKLLYRSCTEVFQAYNKSMTSLLQLLQSFGGWPAITENWTAENFDVNTSIADAYRLFGEDIILQIFVTKSPSKNRNRSQTLYVLKPSNFFLPEQVLLHQEKHKARIDSYKSYFIGMAKEFANYSGAPIVDSDLESQVKNVIEFEARLVRCNESVSNNSDPQFVETSVFEMDNLLHQLFSYMGLDLEISFIKKHLVSDKNYISNLTQILKTTDARTAANYFSWRLVSSLSPVLLTNEIRLLRFNFAKVNYGITKFSPREEHCLSLSLGMFGMALASKYLENADFDTTAVKSNVDEMVGNIKASMGALLNDALWMDQETKRAAVNKLQAMKTLVAYPDWIFKQSRIEKEYKNLRLSPNDLLLSIQQYFLWRTNSSFELLGKTVEKTDYGWAAHPLTLNAFNSPAQNKITIPMAMLQVPMYSDHRLDALNYGGIGTVIGHEIGHGFDTEGLNYDSFGNRKDWWARTSREAYNKKAECFIGQSGDQKTNLGPINGTSTVNENISDNLGIRQAFWAFKHLVEKKGNKDLRLPGLEMYTQQQLFFLNYAHSWCQSSTPESNEYQFLQDPHSLNKFRVLSPLRNFEEFAQHWDCPVGSPMNPPMKDKCILW